MTVSFSITHNISHSSGWGRLKASTAAGKLVQSSTGNEWVSAPHSGETEAGTAIKVTLQTSRVTASGLLLSYSSSGKKRLISTDFRERRGGENRDFRDFSGRQVRIFGRIGTFGDSATRDFVCINAKRQCELSKRLGPTGSPFIIFLTVLGSGPCRFIKLLGLSSRFIISCEKVGKRRETRVNDYVYDLVAAQGETVVIGHFNGLQVKVENAKKAEVA